MYSQIFLQILYYPFEVRVLYDSTNKSQIFSLLIFNNID